MSQEEYAKLYQELNKKYGIDTFIQMLTVSCPELVIRIRKLRRKEETKERVIEAIADTMNCLEVVMEYFGITSSQVAKVQNEKNKREEEDLNIGKRKRENEVDNE